MRVADDGKSIDISVEEAIKLATLGYVCIVNEEGKVIQIIQKNKEEVGNDEKNL